MKKCYRLHCKIPRRLNKLSKNKKGAIFYGSALFVIVEA